MKRFYSGTLLLLSMTLCGVAMAQIATPNIDPGIRKPTVRYKGTDPEHLPKPQGPSGFIKDVTGLATSDVQAEYLQGRGDIETARFAYFVTVRNPGTSQRGFRIRTEVDGGRGSRSGPFSVPADTTQRKPIGFRSDFGLPTGETRLSVNVILEDLEGVEIDRASRVVAVARASREPEARTAPRADLSVSSLRIDVGIASHDLSDIRVGGERLIYTQKDYTRARVTIQNTGTERWGYQASVSVNYAYGRPGSLTPMDGPAGVREAVPGGLAPGAFTNVDLQFGSALKPGYYYTANIRIDSRDDQVDQNNRLTYVFFVENDGRVTPVSD